MWPQSKRLPSVSGMSVWMQEQPNSIRLARSKKKKKITFTCVYTCTHFTAHMESEENFRSGSLSFHHVQELKSGHQFVSKYLYLISHLASMYPKSCVASHCLESIARLRLSIISLPQPNPVFYTCAQPRGPLPAAWAPLNLHPRPRTFQTRLVSL